MSRLKSTTYSVRLNIQQVAWLAEWALNNGSTQEGPAAILREFLVAKMETERGHWLDASVASCATYLEQLQIRYAPKKADRRALLRALSDEKLRDRMLETALKEPNTLKPDDGEDGLTALLGTEEET